MLKTFYEFENENNITCDNISEYCKAEHLNEEYGKELCLNMIRMNRNKVSSIILIACFIIWDIITKN